MNISNRCWNVLLHESAQNGVFIDANSPPLSYTTLNFDSIEDRIHYLFKYSPYHILLSKTSIIEFASQVPGAIEILNTLCSIKNLSICSVSSGFGEDIIGFLSAVSELHLLPKGSLSIRLIDKFDSSFETAKNLFDAHNFHLCNSFEYIHCDPLTTWTAEAKHYVAQADAVFLSFPFVKYINKSSIFHKFIKDLFKSLKPGGVVFCFFQRKQDEYFRSKEFGSSILNNSLEVQVNNVPFNDLFLEIVGITPILSGHCYLTVWKNKDSGIPLSPSVQNDMKTNQEEPQKYSSSSVISILETNQKDNVPESLENITVSERLLTSLMGSLKYLDTVLKNCKKSPNSNSLLKRDFSKNEAVEIDSLVNALLSLEESLKRLCCVLKKYPSFYSATSEHIAVNAENEINTLITNDMEDHDNTNSNDSLSLFVQSLNNLIDRLEVH